MAVLVPWILTLKDTGVNVNLSTIDLNSEEYKGTSISLPHPVLVVKGKRCLENHYYQIEVTNFVGISTKSIKSKRKKIHSHFLLSCLLAEEQTTE